MTESISIFGLCVSLILPWFCGSIWTYWLLRQSGHYNSYTVVGHGYLLGILITTMLIRVWDFAGFELHFASLAAALFAFSIAGIMLVIRQLSTSLRLAGTSPDKPIPQEKWEIAVISILLALLCYRYATLAQEILMRPLFPWDAWMNWAPKAIVWFHQKSLIPYIGLDEWRQQSGDTLAYTLGNWQAWSYPITVPLIQLWSMLGAETSDSPLLQLPWLMAALALGAALYGQLKLSGASALTATMACYCLLNLPYVNVHTALAGYADLWLAAAFGQATFALHQWNRTRHWSYGVLTLFLALLCTQLKVPGMVLGLIVVVVLTLLVIKPNIKTVVLTGIIVASLLVYMIVIGIDFDLPGFGHISVSSSYIELPYIGKFELMYHEIHDTFRITLYLMINWNMLWYLLMFALLLSASFGGLGKPPSPELVLVFMALLFIGIAFYFTRHYIAAVTFTTINRALLYTTPVLVFYIFARFTTFAALKLSRG